MRWRVLILCVVSLVGCAGNSNKDDGGFYTWVDARGNIQTLQKPKVKKDEISKTAVKDASLKQSPAHTQTLDPNDYTPSDVIDRQLEGKREVSWIEGNKQFTSELNLEMGVESQPEKIEYDFGFNYLDFREGKELLLSDIAFKEIKLSDIFHFNKKQNTDYLLVDIDIEFPFLFIDSYINNNKAAMLNVVFLNQQYQGGVGAESNVFFSEYNQETWYSYPYFSGGSQVPEKAKYILLTPSSVAGVIETFESEVVISDLGVIQIRGR